MAHKTEGGDCPLTVNAIIRKRAADENISLRKMVAMTAEETGIPEDTISTWFWPRKKSARNFPGTPESAVKNDGTSLEVKNQIEDVAKAIATSQISNEDIKTLDKAMVILNGS